MLLHLLVCISQKLDIRNSAESFSGLFYYQKTVVGISSSTEFENSISITKLISYILLVLIWLSTVNSNVNQSEDYHLLRIDRYLNFPSTISFPLLHLSFSIWGGKHILYLTLFIFCFPFEFFKHSINVTIKAYATCKFWYVLKFLIKRYQDPNNYSVYTTC